MRYYQLFNTAFLSTCVAPWVMNLVPESLRLLPSFESRCEGSWGWYRACLLAIFAAVLGMLKTEGRKKVTIS